MMVSVAVTVPFAVLPVVVIIVVPLPTAPPVTGIIAVTVVARGRPIAAGIWRAGPVTGVPIVARTDRIPVSVHPRVVRTGARRRRVGDHRRRRRCVIARRTDADANRKMRLGEQGTSGEHHQEQFRFHEMFLFPPPLRARGLPYSR